MYMSLIIDQSWVHRWISGPPTAAEMEEYLNNTRREVARLPRRYHGLLYRFPLGALVHGLDPELEVPYPLSLGIVTGYRVTRTEAFATALQEIAVRQTPTSESVWVEERSIQFVRTWKSVQIHQVKRVVQEAQS